MFALSVLLWANAPGHAQAPLPPPGFVPPYEIVTTLRSAGFDPQAPPMREGATYVVRATDFRGILMRVVVDARTGAIRDANRIVPAAGPGSQIGLGPYTTPRRYEDGPPYGAPLYEQPPLMPDAGTRLMRPPFARPALRAVSPAPAPLPRPRPASIAARKPIDDAKPNGPPGVSADPKPEIKTDVTPAAPEPKPAVTTAAPPAPTPKPAKAAPTPPITD